MKERNLYSTTKQTLSFMRMSRGMTALLGLLAALLVVPLGIDSDFIYHVFITICLYGALATAWNIIAGFGGKFSLGHAIFYGLGAYIAGLLVTVNVSPWIGMLGGAAAAAGVSVLLGWICFRLRGPFYVLSTVAAVQVFFLLAVHFDGITGGSSGIIVPLRMGWEWMIFREREPSLFIAFGLLAFAILVSWLIRRSRFGFYLIAARERESAAMAAGINTVRIQLSAAAISGALCAMVGTFHGMYTSFIEPQEMFSLQFSIEIALFALIGGIGTVAGPLLGTLLIVPLTELARGWLGSSAVGLHGFVYGTTLVLIVLFLPNGLMSLGQTRFFRRFTGTGDEAGTVERESPSTTAAEPEAQVATAGRDMSDRTEVLRAKGLNKNFFGLQVTDNVDLSLHEGEVLGIIGPNGAGKTTAFNMLSGFMQPDSGTVEVRGPNGTFMQPSTPHEFARLGVGRTFQIVQPFATMTVAENIMVGAFHRHPGRKEAREKALEVADRMGLWESRDLQARHLTIGGQKRLEVARVMASEPRILLLDEVMAGLNQRDVREAVRLIETIRDSGTSIIAIEHVMQAIMALSDRIVVINAGQVIANGRPNEVVQDSRVIEAYLGEEFVHAEAQ